MAEQLYGLTATDVQRIKRMLRAYENDVKANTPRHAGDRQVKRDDCLFGRADDTISGSTTSTPGSGTVSLWKFTSTGGTTDTGDNVTAHNMTDRDIRTQGWVILHRDWRSNRWMITNGANVAYMYHALLQGALASSTAATCTVDNLAPMDASVGTTATSLTAQNRLGWTGLDNANAYVAYNHNAGTHDLIQLECS